MGILTNVAHAASGSSEESNALMGLVPFIGIFVIFYFLLIRPQNKRMKEHKEMLAGLSTGALVSTNGGIVGTVVSINDGFVKLLISENEQMVLKRHAISEVLEETEDLKAILKTSVKSGSDGPSKRAAPKSKRSSNKSSKSKLPRSTEKKK